MPVLLSEAAERFAHADKASSWEIMSPDPNNGGEITAQTEVLYARVTYTDSDGNNTVQFLESLRDCCIYIKTITAVWELLDTANRSNEAVKNICYQEVVNMMEGQVAIYGEGYLPPDIKQAINEIKEYLNTAVF